jgi:hypothetical protein
MNLTSWSRILSRLDEDYTGDATLLERLRRVKHRADVVDTLPAHAPRGYLLMSAGDPDLFIGMGQGQALRRVPTLPRS